MGQNSSSERARNSVEARHCVPLGLYPKCPWDLRSLKRLIMEKKLAPIFKGVDDPPENVVMDECPICMLYYPGGLNVARCCKKDICTECFLQIRLPGNAPRPACPFCQREGFDISFSGPKSAAVRAKEEEEERKVRELEAKVRAEEKERDAKREKELAEKRAREAEEAKMAAVDPSVELLNTALEAASLNDEGDVKGLVVIDDDFGEDEDEISVEMPSASSTSVHSVPGRDGHSMDIPGHGGSPASAYAFSPEMMPGASPAEVEEFMIRQAIALSLGQEPEPLPGSFS